MRILAVDDEPLFLELLSETLAEIGYSDVKTVESADEAKLAIQTAGIPFDCFLLDIQMPGTNGIELCRYIRRKVIYRNAPVLMVTAMSEKHYVDSAFAVGATDYVNKPLEIGELRARLHTLRNLIKKSQENLAMQMRLQEIGDAETATVSFGDHTILEDVDGLISYLALENYLLKLGNMRMFIYSAIGFQVENANAIFASNPSQDFADLMAEVADSIREALCGRVVFLAYAGSGEFVGIVPKASGMTKDSLEERITALLDERMEIWTGLGLPLPIIRAGSPIYQSLMSLKRPSDVLVDALRSARKDHGRPNLRRFLRPTG